MVAFLCVVFVRGTECKGAAVRNTLKQAGHGLETSGVDNLRTEPLSEGWPKGTMFL